MNAFQTDFHDLPGPGAGHGPGPGVPAESLHIYLQFGCVAAAEHHISTAKLIRDCFKEPDLLPLNIGKRPCQIGHSR